MKTNISARLTKSLLSVLENCSEELGAELGLERVSRTAILEGIARNWLVERGYPLEHGKRVARFVAHPQITEFKGVSRKLASPTRASTDLDLDLDTHTVSVSGSDTLRVASTVPIEFDGEEMQSVFELHARLFPLAAAKGTRSERRAYRRLLRAGISPQTMKERLQRDYLSSAWLRGEKRGDSTKRFLYWFSTFASYLEAGKDCDDFQSARRKTAPREPAPSSAPSSAVEKPKKIKIIECARAREIWAKIMAYLGTVLERFQLTMFEPAKAAKLEGHTLTMAYADGRFIAYVQERFGQELHDAAAAVGVELLFIVPEETTP